MQTISTYTTPAFISTIGTAVTWTRDIQAVVKKAKLDYEVIKSPIFYIADTDVDAFGNHTYLPIKNNFVCVNKKTGYYYSTVSKNYKVANNDIVFTFLNPVCAKVDGPKPIYAGSIENGCKAFIYFHYPESPLDDIEIDSNFIATNSHDSKNGIEILWLPYSRKYECCLFVPETKQIYKHVEGFTTSRPKYEEFIEKVNKGVSKLSTFQLNASKIVLSDADYSPLIASATTNNHTGRDETAYSRKAVARVCEIARERCGLVPYTLWDVYLAFCKYAEAEWPYKPAEVGIMKEFQYIRNIYGCCAVAKMKMFYSVNESTHLMV